MEIEKKIMDVELKLEQIMLEMDFSMDGAMDYIKGFKKVVASLENLREDIKQHQNWKQEQITNS